MLVASEPDPIVSPVGSGALDVYGASDALDAPLKPGEPDVAEGSGIAVVLLGFKTLLIPSAQIHQ